MLASLAAARDTDLAGLIAERSGLDPALDAALHLDPALLRQLVSAKLRDNNVISGAYKHVDGTSFAAPIVASVAAQMFEAHPGLTPQEAKGILMRTARRLPHVDPDRQGWGVVDARRAVEDARGLGHTEAKPS
jgi:serine protease AprX